MYKNIIRAKINTEENCHSPGNKHISAINKVVMALIGQPNSGKTTLFNALTNSNYKTSNYPGATVEYSAGELVSKNNFKAIVLDSPGIISLIPNSPDEEVTVDALFNHPVYGLPEAVIVTTDSTQLSRQLFLAKQLIDAGFNVVVAVTMSDLLRKKGLRIDVTKFSSLVNCPVIQIDSRTHEGIEALTSAVINLLQSKNEDIKILKPSTLPAEKIIEAYRITEEIEKSVITEISEFDIKEINDKVFKQFNRDPDEQTIKLDKIFLHSFWGLIIFIISMGLIFTSIFWIAQPLMFLIDYGFSLLAEGATKILPASTWYNDLITKGLIGGVGSVAVFIPQITILFLFLGVLEDSGYLARSAMIIDKPLRMFGLNGRSFVPMISGYACAIPAIMAARTITNRKERMLTIFVIPLMSCSARLPVYALLLAFLVPPDKPWIAGIGLGALYLFSLISGSFAAGIVNKFTKSKEQSSFMLELPAYRKPVISHILKNTYYKSAIYLKQAGPTIIIISIILWALTYFPNIDPKIDKNKLAGLDNAQTEKLIESERLNTSLSSYLGKVMEPVLKPLGWDWRIGVSLISAFAAREVFVSALALTLSVTDEYDENMQTSMVKSMNEAHLNNSDKHLFTTASAISLIIYFMFAMQCLSTVVVTRKETGSWKIPLLQILIYSTGAYLISLIVYNSLHFFGVN
jgi:ferrous iron transport protein B